MANNQNTKDQITFEEFLTKLSGLLTVFGVLNALILFTRQLQDSHRQTSLILSLCFYFLSILVWWEIINFSLKHAKGRFKFLVFYFLSTVIEITLTILFISEFKEFLSVVLALLILTLVLLGATFPINYIIKRFKLFKGFSNIQERWANLLLMFFSMEIGIIIVEEFESIFAFLRKLVH